MKYVIIRCEDHVPDGRQVVSLMDGAKLAHLRQLAQAGAGGLIKGQAAGAVDRFQTHKALFGLEDADDLAAGRCYAESAGLRMGDDESVWCCELVTQRDGAIIDPVAGHIPTKEAEVLVQAVGSQLGSDTRRWQVGQGTHHAFVVKDRAWRAGAEAPPAPELLLSEPWKRRLPRGAQGEALAALITQAARILEPHPVNRVRIDLGENPANMMWFWSPAGAAPPRRLHERSGLSAAVLSNGFLLRGFAKALGLDLKEGPASLQEGALQRLLKAALPATEKHDVVYVHIVVESADPVERLCAMERIDQLVLKPLSDALAAGGRLLVAIDDRTARAVPFIALGAGLPQEPLRSLTLPAFAESRLAFQDGAGIFAWFTQGRSAGEPRASKPAKARVAR
jgi:2,3-bisphosphoglycerate-independent phosphoglycerate mutase